MDSGSQEPQDPVKDWFAMGFFGGLLLTASCFVLIGLVGQVSGGKFLGTGLMSSAMLYTYFAIGVVQLLWLTPIVIVLWRARYRKTAYGFITSGALVALLNGGCWIMLGNAMR